jgi:hypothetical protein
VSKPVDGCGCGECREAWRLLLAHHKRKEDEKKPLRREYEKLLRMLDAPRSTP